MGVPLQFAVNFSLTKEVTPAAVGQQSSAAGAQVLQSSCVLTYISCFMCLTNKPAIVG